MTSGIWERELSISGALDCLVFPIDPFNTQIHSSVLTLKLLRLPPGVKVVPKLSLV